MKIGILEQVAGAGGGGGAVPSTIPIYKGSLNTQGSFPTGSDTTLSYINKDVGVAHAKRILILATYVETGWEDSIAPKVNDVAMTPLSSVAGGSGSSPDYIQLWWIALPTGVTANISTVIRGAREFFAYYWIAYPDTAAPIEVGFSNWAIMGGPSSVTLVISNLDTQLNGFIIVASNSSSTDQDIAWNGTGTKTVNANVSNTHGFKCGASMVTGTALSTTGDLSVTGGLNKGAVAASWGASP